MLYKKIYQNYLKWEIDKYNKLLKVLKYTLTFILHYNDNILNTIGDYLNYML
jgi:hypothetical protein